MTTLSCRIAWLRTGVLILGLAGGLLVPLGCNSGSGATSTTTSVTLAPRARMAVKAAWPGVSIKVMRPPSGDTTW